MVRELGRHIPDFQVFVRDKTRHIYDERHREPEFHLPASEQPAQFIPQRPVVTQGAVLVAMEATKKWRLPIRDRGKIYGELSIMYDGRLPD